MKEDCPPSSADDPGNGNATAVSFKVIAALSTDHGIDGTSPIKLQTTLSETEQRGCSGREGDNAGGAVHGKRLDLGSAAGGDRKR